MSHVHLISSENALYKAAVFTDLPQKATSKIFGALPLPQLLIVARVCQIFYLLARQDQRLAYCHINAPATKTIKSEPLQLSVNVHEKEEFVERTLLHYAAGNNLLALVSILLAKGADPHATDWRKQTPLHIACDSPSHPSIIRTLVQGGADPLALDQRRKTALERAITQSSSGYYKAAMTRVILEMIKQYDLQKLDFKNEEDETLLHIACTAENPKVALALLDKGMDPTLKDNSGETAYDKVLNSFDLFLGNQEIMELAYQMILKAPSLKNIPNREGDTALHMACKFGNKKLIELFVKEPGNFFVKNHKNLTPLILMLDTAETHSDKEIRITMCCIAILLISDDKTIDVNTRNSSGKTLCHLTVQLRNRVLLNYLIKNRQPNLLTKDLSGKTPLEYSKSDEISALLIGGNVTILNAMNISRYIDNLFGIGGTWNVGSWTFSGEGYTTKLATDLFSNAMHSFFSFDTFEELKQKHPELKEIDLTDVKEALNRLPHNETRSAQELTAHIKGGHIEALLTNWKFPNAGHVAGIAFIGPWLLAKCERGGHPGIKTGITFYTITKPHKIEESIELLRKQGQEENGWPYFTTGINETLGLFEIGHSALSKQKKGNCPMAGCHGILRSLLTPVIPDFKLRRIAAKTAVERELRIAICLGLIAKEKNIPLLKAVYHKIEQASPTQRLGKLKAYPEFTQLKDFVQSVNNTSTS